MPTAAYQSVVNVAQNPPLTVLTVAGARLRDVIRDVLQHPVPVLLAKVAKNKLVGVEDVAALVQEDHEGLQIPAMGAGEDVRHGLVEAVVEDEVWDPLHRVHQPHLGHHAVRAGRPARQQANHLGGARDAQEAGQVDLAGAE